MIILHVDMDAFYASVEERDNPNLRGKALIIGSFPHERGVVSTCNYEARKYGIRSAMNSKEAYRLCPKAIFMHPNYDKYKKVSAQLHRIWRAYSLVCESIALDEAYLDLSHTAKDYEAAKEIALTIQARIKEELHLSCSIGIGYNKSAAKTASEEKKPGGYFEIRNRESYISLLKHRSVSVLHGVGKKTAAKLKSHGLHKVEDIYQNPEKINHIFGKQGQVIIDLSQGIDSRKVVAYRKEDAKSISREITFQKDVSRYHFLRHVLLLLCIDVYRQLKQRKLYAKGITLKLTYTTMQSINRSKMIEFLSHPYQLYQEACKLLHQVDQHSVRLLGVGVCHLSNTYQQQLTIYDSIRDSVEDYRENMIRELQTLQEIYDYDFQGNLPTLYQQNQLYNIIEYMRKKEIHPHIERRMPDEKNHY